MVRGCSKNNPVKQRWRFQHNVLILLGGDTPNSSHWMQTPHNASRDDTRAPRLPSLMASGKRSNCSRCGNNPTLRSIGNARKTDGSNCQPTPPTRTAPPADEPAHGRFHCLLGGGSALGLGIWTGGCRHLSPREGVHGGLSPPPPFGQGSGRARPNSGLIGPTWDRLRPRVGSVRQTCQTWSRLDQIWARLGHMWDPFRKARSRFG